MALDRSIAWKLLNAGTLSRARVGAAKRLRRDTKTGLMTGGAVDSAKAPTASGETSDGVSERRLQLLERFRPRRLLSAVLLKLLSYLPAGRCVRGLRGAARDPARDARRLFAAIEMLQGHYDAIDENTKGSGGSITR